MEVFSKQRISRCLAIFQKILNANRGSRSLRYVVRASKDLQGATLQEIRKEYFSVGVASSTEDVPFTDLLVIFHALMQNRAALLAHRKKKGKESDFRLKFEVTTDWPDDQAVALLQAIVISWPGNPGKYLRFQRCTKRDPSNDT